MYILYINIYIYIYIYVIVYSNTTSLKIKQLAGTLCYKLEDLPADICLLPIRFLLAPQVQ